MINNISVDPQSQNKQILSFLYLAKEDFSEAIRFAGLLLSKYRNVDSGGHASIEGKALDIALVVTYVRPFKKNYGFDDVKPYLSRALHDYSNIQSQLHEKIISVRDREYAHADADSHDVQIYFNEIYDYSRRFVREPLLRSEAESLIEMCQILITSMDKQIIELKSSLDTEKC